MTKGALAGLDPCVHCGFCLQSCPTFLATGDESDSPRGRIVLMQGLASGTLSATDATLRLHLDRCLGCRACEPPCPAGVAYGPALEETRHRLWSAESADFVSRSVLAVMGDSRLSGPIHKLARLFRPLAGRLAGGSRFGFAMGMLAATEQADWRAGGQKDQAGHKGLPDGRGRAGGRLVPTESPPSSTATLFLGCIMAGLFEHVHAATRRTLRVNGYEIVGAPERICCGALHAHAGDHETALTLARRNVAAYGDGGETIVVNSAGCGAMLKDYGRLLSDDPLADQAKRFSLRVRDVSEALAGRGPRPGAPLGLKVAYDPPCHLLHAQRVSQPVEAVLGAIPGLERVRHHEAELCCGSAGLYSLVEPALSREILSRKVSAIQSAKPDVIATGNPGCIMQIGAGLRATGDTTPVVHPVELLDRSYTLAGLGERGT